MPQALSLNPQDPFSNNDFLPVDEAFRFDFQLQGNQLTLSWDIAEGYYLYQHRFIADPDVPLAAPVELPAGVPYEDAFFGESVVYRQQVTLQYNLQDAQAQSQFVISYQGCADAGLCYPPTEKVVYLPGSQQTLQTTTEKVDTHQSFELPWWALALLPLAYLPILWAKHRRQQAQQ